MRLSELGERKAIELISKLLSRGKAAVWIGDDCAALAFDQDYLLISTDMISQKTHMPFEMTPFQIGWFSVAINLSDLAAKGGKPIGLVLSLGLPKKTSDSFLKELMKGADTCATRFGTSIIGGDTKEAQAVLVCGTAVGIVKKNEFMPRQGAKPGDIVAVTGTVGRAGAGYCALKHNVQDPASVKGLMEPMPRLKEGRALAEEKIVSSCMDISDGLSSSLYQLQDLNRVGFDIEQEQLPVSAALRRLQKQLNIDVYKYALHFGGDYELLVTIPPTTFERAVKAVKKTGNTLTAIGSVTKEKKIMLIAKNVKKILANRGYEHFKKHVF